MLNEAKRHRATSANETSVASNRCSTRRVGTQAALETSETEYHTAAVRVEALTASVALAKRKFAKPKKRSATCAVVAPFAGTVVTKDAEVGETIMPGGMGLASGRGSVATLANLDQLEVDTDVKEDYLGGLEKGQPAEVTVDAVPNRRYQGRLREIIPMGDRTRGIVKVKVSILDPDERLFPDLGATVHFQPAKSERPRTPAKRSCSSTARPSCGKEIANSSGVGEDQAVQVTVRERRRRQRRAEAHHGDIRSGERVILDPSPELAEGMKVRVEE